MSSSEKEKSTVQSVERAFLILELLALHTTAGLTLTQLAKMSKLHKSTAVPLDQCPDADGICQPTGKKRRIQAHV